MKDKQATIQDLEELPPFHSSARHGNAEELTQLLAVHPDLIDYGDSKGFTALMHAVFAKSMSCVKILLQCGSKPEIVDGKGRTALHFCARMGWSEGAEILIKFGANCGTADSKGRNALHFGACSYEDSCVEDLLSRCGSDTVNKADCEGMTPLHWASFHNVWENVDLLLRNGADPTILDKEDKTALHWAAQNGCASVCKVLLGSELCKSFINEKTNGAKTALHLAAIGGHLDVIFELAQGNAFNADTGDQEKRTALHWACAVGSDRCVAGLLRLGVKHDMPDDYGISPATYARKLNHHLCVSLLENFDERRPQHVLIPMESLSDLTENKEKVANHKASLSNLENDVFLLLPSTGKEEAQVEKIVQLHQQSINHNYKMNSLAVAIGEVLDGENRDADSDFFLSGDDTNHMVEVIENDACTEAAISEDESRCQPQMAVTPPNAFLLSQMDMHSMRKDKNKDIKPHRKVSKQSGTSPYKLAPIRSKPYKQQSPLKIPDRSPSSRDGRSPSSRTENLRKISTQTVDQKYDMVLEPKGTNKNELNGGFDVLERPLGLRRKSLSMNDGLIQYAMKIPEKITISRAQSYAQMKPIQGRLPVIDIRDGRNLTQRMHHNQADVGYDGQDEVSHISIQNKDKKRKRSKRKQRISRYER